MTLGAIIGRLRNRTFVEETLAGLDDIVLLTRLRAAADASQEPLCDLAVGLVGKFVRLASDEAWLSLISTAVRANDPAIATLRCMLNAALQMEGTLYRDDMPVSCGAPSRP